MGDEITKSTFQPEDFDRFGRNLSEETNLLSDMVDKRLLSDAGYVAGFEIETWLLDHGFFPNPVNETFLAALGHPLVVPELSRFNVELNCDPVVLTGDALRRVTHSLTDLLAQCNQVAHALDANMVMIGTLPVIRDEDLTLAHISPLKRYAALNTEILRQRGGRNLIVDIEGDEHLHSEHHDVMLEAATTSFQIHLKTPADVGHRFYNASIIASGPVLAAAVNAPYMFGQSLWDETRIPLFEQSIALTDRAGRHGRVSFGSGYVDATMFEALAENVAAYPILLPILFDDSAETLRHVRLHNGTIWRWNRPLIGFEPNGTPHLRIEHRSLPAGPTIIDMIANAALYFGLVRGLVDTGFDESGDLSFVDASANFYGAARHGLDARFQWLGGDNIPAETLLLDELIPLAHRGLKAFGIDETDRDIYLNIVEARVRSRQTGSAWQRAALSRRGGDFFELMSDYCEGQRSRAPVHQWDL